MTRCTEGPRARRRRAGTAAAIILFASTPLILFASTPLAAQSPALGAATTRPALRVGADPQGTIRVDGRLDDAAWATADSIGDLTQIEPVEGQRPSGRTTVRVVATADALVFGIDAHDPDPRSITSFSRNRDANLSNEDHVRSVRTAGGGSTRTSCW